jgi:hypothetical protein
LKLWVIALGRWPRGLRELFGRCRLLEEHAHDPLEPGGASAK